MRGCNAAAALIIALTPVAGIGLADSADAAPRFDCGAVHILFARGTSQGPGEAEFTTFRRLVEGAINSLAVATTRTRELGDEGYGGYDYAPETNTLGHMLEARYPSAGREEYRENVSEGTSEAVLYLTHRIAACKQAGISEQLVLGGYSQGAHVIGEAVKLLRPHERAQIAYIALFGDPKLHNSPCGVPKYSWVEGSISCDEQGGILTPRKNPYFPSDLTTAGRIGSWCDDADAICTGQESKFGIGTAHDSYPGSEMFEAASKVLQNLRSRIPQVASARYLALRDGDVISSPDLRNWYKFAGRSFFWFGNSYNVKLGTESRDPLLLRDSRA